MRKIAIEFEVTEAEYDLLVMAKADQPHPSRIRTLLLHDAKSCIGRVIREVEQAQRDASQIARHAAQHNIARVK